MAASAVLTKLSSPPTATAGDEFSIRCEAQNTGDTDCYLHIILYDADTSAILYDYGKHGLIGPGGTLNPFPGTYPVQKLVTMPDHDWNLIAKVFVDDRTEPDDSLTKTIALKEVPPTITDLSWSPKGEYKALSAGASLVGATEQLKVITTNHADYPDLIDEGEAYLERLDLEGNSLDTFAVAEYDHFRFDNEEWWALNIICGPECDIVTFANETAEALKTPKIGDEIQFTCKIDWHGAEPDRVEWYYAKAPNKCFDKAEADALWELFASEQLHTHTFEADDDHEIVFLKVLAKNKAGDIGELGDTCRPIFNLWKYKPPWWDSLLASVRTANDEIATPITALFTGGRIQGWTTPPFECPICEQVFEGEGSELEYGKHLMSHIKAFENG